MGARIRCTAKVRELLFELDKALEQFGEQTRILAAKDTDPSTAINVGADRESTRNLIVGIAWRINKASKGIE